MGKYRRDQLDSMRKYKLKNDKSPISTRRHEK